MAQKLVSKILGEGAPVLLLHGLFGSKDSLSRLANALSKYFQVHAIDLRNHGSSPHFEDMDLDAMALDVHEYMFDQELSTASLIGHSLGGKVAMQFALDYPIHLEKLIVVDIAPVSYPPHHQDIIEGMKSVAEARPTTRTQADAIFKEFESDPFTRQFLLKNLRKNREGIFDWVINLASIEKNYQNLLRAPRSKQPFKGKVLFVAGQNSDYILKKHREETMALFPNAKLQIVPEASHYLHVEKPELFNRLCLRYLRDE